MTAIEIVKIVDALLEKNRPITEDKSKDIDATRDGLMAQNNVTFDEYYEAVDTFYGAEMDEAIAVLEATI